METRMNTRYLEAPVATNNHNKSILTKYHHHKEKSENTFVISSLNHIQFQHHGST